MWKQTKAVGDLAVKNTFVYFGVILDMGHEPTRSSTKSMRPPVLRRPGMGGAPLIKALQGGIQCKQRAAREVLLYTFCKGHCVDCRSPSRKCYQVDSTPHAGELASGARSYSIEDTGHHQLAHEDACRARFRVCG